MTASYLPCEPDQDLLRSRRCAINCLIATGHFISDSIDALDRSAFHARYQPGGPRKPADTQRAAPTLGGPGGGGSCSEIKEERAATRQAGDIRGMSHPLPVRGCATSFC